jgi:hypothetical protein
MWFILPFFHNMTSGAFSDDKRAKHSLPEWRGVQVKLHRYRVIEALLTIKHSTTACPSTASFIQITP